MILVFSKHHTLPAKRAQVLLHTVGHVKYVADEDIWEKTRPWV